MPYPDGRTTQPNPDLLRLFQGMGFVSGALRRAASDNDAETEQWLADNLLLVRKVWRNRWFGLRLPHGKVTDSLSICSRYVIVRGEDIDIKCLHPDKARIIMGNLLFELGCIPEPSENLLLQLVQTGRVTAFFQSDGQIHVSGLTPTKLPPGFEVDYFFPKRKYSPWMNPTKFPRNHPRELVILFK